jgi:signal transduction histidine kinase
MIAPTHEPQRAPERLIDNRPSVAARAAAPSPLSTRLVLLSAALVLSALMAVVAPLLFQWVLHLSPDEATFARRAFLLALPLDVVLLGITIALGLRNVERVHAPNAEARRRVLALPFRLAFIAVFGSELTTFGALLLDRLRGATPLPVAAGLVLCTSTQVALLAVPLYAIARAALQPLALRHADESPPRGRPLSLRVQLGYTIFTIAAAAVVPAAVFGTAQLNSAATTTARARAEHTAERLLVIARTLDLAEATRLTTRTPLADGERVVLRAPSGLLLPEDAAEEVSWMPYVELPLSGPLAGGALRLYYTPAPVSPAPLVVMTLALLVLALAVASTVGVSAARDARGVAGQIALIAKGESPPPLATVTTSEVRRVMLAVNRLLDRIPRLTVESFLAIEHAEEARRLKSQFLANMSHDLRSPLNSILGFSELLLRGIEGPITTGQQVMLAAVHVTATNLLRLLTEILDTAKMESGRMELHRQSTPPTEIVNQAVQEARRGRAPQVLDQLSVELQAGMAPVYVDPLRMTQAMTHLINYGFDAAQGGRVTLNVSEGELKETRVLLVDVEHDGSLAVLERSRVFDGFRRIPGTQGLNLALPLAKRIVELHGGTLDLTLGSEGRPRFRAVVPVGIRREQTTPIRGFPRIP